MQLTLMYYMWMNALRISEDKLDMELKGDSEATTMKVEYALYVIRQLISAFCEKLRLIC